jgi:hypothetical protein
MIGRRPTLTRNRRLVAALTTVLATVLLCGCGLEAGTGTTATHYSLLVTKGFGAQNVLNVSAPKTAGTNTVLGMLERNATVTAPKGGGPVASINGLAADSSGSQATGWSFYVNGVGSRKGAATTKLHNGDEVWWDRHDTAAAKTVAAVVGSYPDPFLGGYGGHRYPTRIECTQTKAADCTSVLDQLATYGIPAALGCFECSEYNLSLRVLVGPYATITADPAADELRDGPSTSGVYARFIDGGSKLELLNARGAVKQTFGAGTGLVAAARWHGEPPVWFITGTDAAGVADAEQAFTAGTLDGHFAVAVVNDIAEPLPLAPGSRPVG